MKPFLTHNSIIFSKFQTMENSLRSCFTVAFMVLLLSAGQLQQTEAQSRCDSVQLSWCLQSIVSNMPPSQDCCRRLRGQQACLCRETRDPTFGGYLRHPGARRVATACGVTFPRCN
ncbi:putative bifunctional inhibitor/plant lipid transfer protein/seed storage helical [Helianthus annuus]|uniref:Bifunctional inhibitor/plant lipid transfer protein/seed storage helical n=1 Tax=Helianthus annuus TaxID=4232 RepID=A0A9K3HL42_HELAN|nr:putative bifunctional inhibitor/plant lipid transfer protein/seed storage helical [Helianthus annuus]KAJ0500133.1 putative bifunctional inhibitor/plant lipid transfer protein/seed storage helical [Helianthus annuus]KAJ0507484.1 putative bifunctional inhibitor/plant lipid transfer protein/seed storage helical [Helianthus annuus]KAJ0515975.1 putative bifunctional inhibitor/plant lipid transfer protein/seed storage helical [Helianthus annuus]KAJ0683983.1 putative bifunctional inhibitor/plant li